MMIETRGLRKAFGKKVVLDGIDLNVAAGDNLRAARLQRRGQDHDRENPHHPAQAG